MQLIPACLYTSVKQDVCIVGALLLQPWALWVCISELSYEVCLRIEYQSIEYRYHYNWFLDRSVPFLFLATL